MVFSLIQSLSAPLISLVLVTLGNAFFVTATSLWLQEHGHSTFTIALVGALFNLGQVIGLQMEHLMRRIGHIRLFMTCTSIMAFCIGIQSVFTSSFSWGILRLITGACTAGVFVVIESWLLVLSQPSNRGKILSIYMFFLYFAQATSQWIKQFVDIRSTLPFLVASILCSISAVPLGLTGSSAPRLFSERGDKIIALIKKAPLGCMTCLMSGVILGAGYTFFPLFAQSVERHIPLLTMPLIQFSIICGGFILQYPIGYLSDLFDRRLVLTYLCLVMASVSGLLVFTFSFHPLLILALSIFIGGLTFTVYPLGITQVSDNIEEHDFPKAVSLLIIIFGVGAIFGPLLAQYFIRLIQSDVGVFIHIAFCSLTLMGICFWHMRRFRKVPDKDQGEFVAMPSISALIKDIDPRTDQKKQNFF